MNNNIKEKLQSIGINKGFLWIIINRFFSIIKGPFSAIIQITFLTPAQQGIWYTFSSLGALSVFAEMGFTQIVTQFVSQEYAFLKFENGEIKGSEVQLDKFHSLIRYSIKFFLIIVPLAIILLSLIGFYFFKEENVSVIFAWLIYSVSGGFALVVSLFQSIYQGIDKVPEIQKNIFKNLLVTTIINWGLLACRAGVFALALSGIIGSITTVFLLYRVSPNFWKNHFKYKCKNNYKWGKEILPLQWKYAIGFISSYFIYQLYVPAAYRVDGNILSGQLGMSMMLVSCVRTFSDAFIGGSLPRLNMLAAEKKEKQLLSSFSKLFWGATFVSFIGYLSIIVGLIIIKPTRFSSRFLYIPETIPLLAFNLAINIIGVLGNYTLFHKDGSLYPLTLIAGVVGAITMFVVYPFTKSIIHTFYILAIFYWVILIPANVVAFYYKKNKYFSLLKEV